MNWKSLISKEVKKHFAYLILFDCEACFVGFFVPWLIAGVFILCYSIAGILMEMWMDLGATQQTQEKPGSTVTFRSAVIIPLKTSVSLSCNILWQLEDIQRLIWKIDLTQLQ